MTNERQPNNELVASQARVLLWHRAGHRRPRIRRWIAEQPFAPSYWSFAFGATALAGAVIRFAIDEHNGAMNALAPILFVLVNLLVLGIALRAIGLIFVGGLLPPPSLPQPTVSNISAAPTT